MKFKRTKISDLIGKLEKSAAKAKTPQEREKYETALQLARQGAVPPWIKQ